MGKTRLVAAISHELISVGGTGARRGGTRSDELLALERAVVTGAGIAPTPRDAGRAFEVILEPSDGRGADFQLYDVSGHRYRSDGALDQLRCLHDADGVLVVVDPLSITAVRDQLPSDSLPADVIQEDLLAANSLVLGRLGEVNRQGHAAVVVTKVDLLDGTPVGQSLVAAVHLGQVAEWLEDVGESAFVRRVRSTFEDVGWFACSAVGGFDAGVNLPIAPARWLLGESDGATEDERIGATGARGGAPPRATPADAPAATATAATTAHRRHSVATASAPGCLVVIVDRSATTATVTGPGLVSAHDRIAHVVDLLLLEVMLVGESSPHRTRAVTVGVIGHGDGAGPALRGTLADRDLIEADQLRSLASLRRATGDGDRDDREVLVEFPSWIDPRAEGEPSRDLALQQVRALVDRARQLHPDAPDPVVVEVTATAPSRGDEVVSPVGVPMQTITVDDGGRSFDAVIGALMGRLGIW